MKKQWPEHSLRGYLMRQPTYKLKLIWDARNTPNPNALLQPEDYAWIESILREREDSFLYQQIKTEDRQ